MECMVYVEYMQKCTSVLWWKRDGHFAKVDVKYRPRGRHRMAVGLGCSPCRSFTSWASVRWADLRKHWRANRLCAS